MTVGRWTAGGGWTPLSKDGAWIDDLVLGVDGLYVSGSFTSIGGVPANGVARWDSSTWSALGSGLAQTSQSSPVNIATQGRNLYLAGWFTRAGGRYSGKFAAWHNPVGPNLAPTPTPSP